jgi:hypothetical protein
MGKPYTGEERRDDWHSPADCVRLIEVEERFKEGTERMQRIESTVSDGTERMQRIETSVDVLMANQTAIIETHKRQEAKQDANDAATAELLEIIRMGKGFFRGVAFLGRWFRKIALWVLPLATAILSFWWAITGHNPPK